MTQVSYPGVYIEEVPSGVRTITGVATSITAFIGRTLRGVPTSVVLALRANAGFRAFAGFLIMFMAFLLREHPLSTIPTAILVGVVAGAAGAGALVGTTLGALTRARSPEVVVRALLELTDWSRQ